MKETPQRVMSALRRAPSLAPAGGRRAARRPAVVRASVLTLADPAPVWLTQKEAADRYRVSCYLLREAVRLKVLSVRHEGVRVLHFDSATLDAFFRVHTLADLRALLRRARHERQPPTQAVTEL